jgi:3-phenylpropionate/trans-cinnamate dioxygenase ferredoxin reductase subunit
MSDLRLEIEGWPKIQTAAGQVSAIKKRAPNVVEINIEPLRQVTYLPGQYLRVQFRGYPTRCYYPTASMDDLAERDFLHFQVQRIRRGRVSTVVGSDIREGHRVKIKGPFGLAFLRPASLSRLVLVASGAGFAPIWSIAVAAIREHPRRRIVMVVGARTIESMYMINALCMLARYPNVTIIPVVGTPQNLSTIIRIGSIADHIPELLPDDIVHACGPARLVEAASQLAAAVNAPCHGIPFVRQHTRENVLSRAFGWFNNAVSPLGSKMMRFVSLFLIVPWLVFVAPALAQEVRTAVQCNPVVESHAANPDVVGSLKQSCDSTVAANWGGEAEPLRSYERALTIDERSYDRDHAHTANNSQKFKIDPAQIGR